MTWCGNGLARQPERQAAQPIVAGQHRRLPADRKLHPNSAIQEYPSRTPDIDRKSALLGNDHATESAERKGGFIAIPGAPGIRVGVVEDVERRFPYRARPIRLRPYENRSMVDM
jgi:L-alanine-DL-glutamate epimerase-like enolase superfamily enzyme